MAIEIYDFNLTSIAALVTNVLLNSSVHLICRIVKFWDTRKLKVPVVQTPQQKDPSEEVSIR